LHRFEHQCASASRQMARVLAFSPNGRTLAVVCKPEFADVWNTETGERIERVADSVNAAMITPDGEWLVVSNVQDAVKVRSARRNLLIDSLYDADSPESSIVSAALDADGRYIAAVAANGTLRVWSLSGRRLLRTFEVHQVAPVFESWSNPDDLPSGIALSAQSFNGDARLVIPTADTGAQIWDVQQNKLLQKLGAKGHVNAASFSPDGRYVVTTVADGDTESAEVWDARTGQLSLTLRDERPLRAGLFSPDGKFVLTLHGSGGGFLWDAATGEQLRKTYGDQPSFSHDGKLLLHTYATPLFGSGGGVRHGAVLERTQSGELVHQLEHKQAVYSAAFSPDGSRIVTASWDGVARMWDASSGKLLQSFGGHDGPVRCAAFSPAGGRLVTCGEDRLVKVWDVARGQLLQTLSGHVAPVQFAGFSPHGNMLLSLSSPPESSGSVLRLWDVRLETQPPREVAALVERWVPAPVLSTVVRQTFP
jgi:WD40 repeat protein